MFSFEVIIQHEREAAPTTPGLRRAYIFFCLAVAQRRRGFAGQYLQAIWVEFGKTNSTALRRPVKPMARKTVAAQGRRLSGAE